MEHVSTSVVISGDAMIAGSRCTFLAKSGRTQPISFEIMTVPISESPITRASAISLYMIRMRMPLVSASTTLTIRDTRNSLKMTRKISLNRISPRAIPRMISVALWEPQFQPVSMSIGIKDTSSGIAAKASSYLVIMVPVIVAENIRIRSQTMRCLAWSNTDMSK